MGGQPFELVGLVALAGIAGVFSIVLASAGVQAFGSSGSVGFLFIGFALVLLLTALSVGVWGVVEWIRADGTRATVAALPDRDSEGKIQTIRAAVRQKAFLQNAVKVAFFCCTLNLGAEMFVLRDCKRIFVLTAPPEHHYCDNLSYEPHGLSSLSPQSRTVSSELPGTVSAEHARAQCVRVHRSICLLLAGGCICC